ncbi:MAG: CvpA family protein [Clostridia bacterium]|nr:CvpA family protein [Clostridia bacterium]
MIFLGIMVLSVAICAKRGLFRSIGGIAGTILGYAGARYLSGSVADVFCPYVRQPFFKLFSGVKVQQALSELAQKASQGITDMQVNLHGSLQGAGLDEKTSLMIDGVVEYMGASVSDLAQMETSADMAASLADAAAQAVSPVIAFILIFIVIKFAVSLVCRLLSSDIPVIRDVDALGGVMLGLVSGVLMITLLCWGVMLFAPEETVGFLSRQTLHESYIGGFFATLFG